MLTPLSVTAEDTTNANAGAIAEVALPLAQALARFQHRPGVVGVDIGLLPVAKGNFSVGLRVHLACAETLKQLYRDGNIPSTIDGVQLMLVPMRYSTQIANPEPNMQTRAKYQLKSAGMGQLLMQVLAQQTPLNGRSLCLSARSGRHGQIITFCATQTARQFALSLADLQRDIIRTPTTPAPILCRYNGHLSAADYFDASVTNGYSSGEGHRFCVDGCGFYALTDEPQPRFVAGVRLTPTF